MDSDARVRPQSAAVTKKVNQLGAHEPDWGVSPNGRSKIRGASRVPVVPP